MHRLKLDNYFYFAISNTAVTKLFLNKLTMKLFYQSIIK